MKKTNIVLVLVSLLLLSSIAINLTGCLTSVKAINLMDGVTARDVTPLNNLSEGNVAATDFAIRLFKATNEGHDSTLISPLSILSALAMTANGAKEDTRNQIEAVLGMTVEELNLYLYTYVSALPQGEKYKLSLANSIWIKDDERFAVNRDFLQINADYYGADIYKSPFDNQALKDINNWVKNKTDGMIQGVLDDIPKEAIMYLVNALAFEAEWTKIYEDEQVHDSTFTKEDGTKQDVELMYSSEGKYIEDDKAVGFIKYYKNSEYAFVALLPNEDVTVSEYIDSLDGRALNTLISEAKSVTVSAAIPKFETEYRTELSEILQSMGMPLAFDIENADFGGVGEWSEGNISIGKVLHKTYIQVGERGTKAGAVTSVQLDGATSFDPTEIKEVYLDRPFVYMLIDCENNVPFFIGTMMDIEK